MGWLTKMLSPEDPSAPLWPTSWAGDGFAGNDSGIQLTELNSRSAGGVLACTRVISEAAAAYPKLIYQRMDGGKRVATNHPLWSIINGAPNPQMTNFVFWNGVISQACIWGNGYALIQRDGAYRARALWPLPSGSIQAVRENGVLTYRLTANGLIQTILPENIIHLPFLSYDGIQGYSPVQLRRQSLGLSMAAERFGAMLFGRGARPSGLLEVPATMNQEGKNNLRESWQQGTSGANALGIAIAPPGVTFKPLTINPNDAQFLETRKYQLEDIARDYRVPAHMIGILERATHSNAEQMGYEFSTYTMMTWVLMIEQELQRKLFPDPQYYPSLDMDAYLRGDFETRTTGYQTLRNIGVLSADDINDKEGWQRIGPEKGGDIRIVPMNMFSLESLKKQEDAPPPKAPVPAPKLDEQQQRFAVSFATLFRDATGRTINKDKRDAAFVQRVWTPLLMSLGQSLAVLKGKNELEGEVITFLQGYVGAVAIRCADWTKEAADVTAASEFTRAYTALAERV